MATINDEGSITGIQNPDNLSLAVIDRIKNNIVPAALGLFNIEVKEESGNSYTCVTVATEDEFFKGRSHPRSRELMRIFCEVVDPDWDLDFQNTLSDERWR